MTADPTQRRLSEKVLIVTGATRGIGLAAVERLAAEGARVVLTARDGVAGGEVEARLRAGGCDVVFVPADMTEQAGAEAVVETAMRHYGRLDGAFNNVGGMVAPGRPAEVEPADFQAELDLNLTSAFLCLRAQLPALLAAGGGSVVNNASIAGTTGIGGLTAYVAAKHGVVGLTRAAALAHAGDGVRVNALVTGNVDTPLYRELLGAGPEVERADLSAPNPSGRVAGPEEVAAFVAFLLSDESRFITGAALAVDGGATAG
jgi:NAD(P)-dependent dehydrogenase (short-subunit alcohol dehydrogenase family)